MTSIFRARRQRLERFQKIFHTAQEMADTIHESYSFLDARMPLVSISGGVVFNGLSRNGPSRLNFKDDNPSLTIPFRMSSEAMDPIKQEVSGITPHMQYSLRFSDEKFDNLETMLHQDINNRTFLRNRPLYSMMFQFITRRGMSGAKMSWKHYDMWRKIFYGEVVLLWLTRNDMIYPFLQRFFEQVQQYQQSSEVTFPKGIAAAQLLRLVALSVFHTITQDDNIVDHTLPWEWQSSMVASQCVEVVRSSPEIDELFALVYSFRKIPVVDEPTINSPRRW